MIDFNSKSLLSDRINWHIDTALELEESLQPGRKYLGGSRLGVECERALQYEYWKAPKDEGKHFPGRVLRVFARGHWIESAMIDWLRNAGFGLIPHKKDGGQFGFVDHGGKMKGHNDGVFVSGPAEFGPWPRLWECKGIMEKYHKSLKKNKLQKEYPIYYAQIQTYMAKFKLTDNPALFSAINMNTMEIYWEPVPFVPDFVKNLDAKALRILRACEAGELLPRFWHDPNYFKCKWCNWRETCWKGDM
jgi:hypothetical protein